MKLIIVPITAMLCVTGLEVYALYLGFNGTILAGCMVIVGGLGGYEAKIIRDKYKKKG